MTTSPAFPTTRNIRAAATNGFADIRQVVDRAESQILDACDELDFELNAWLDWLEGQAQLPLSLAEQMELRRTAQIVDDAAAEAEQTNNPVQATGILGRLRRRLGRAPRPQQPEPQPNPPAAPVATPQDPAPAVNQTVHIQQPTNQTQATPQGQRLWFTDNPDSLPGATQWDRDMAWGMNDHDRRIGRVENDVRDLQRSSGGNNALANALKFGGVAAIIMVIFTIIMEIVFWHHTLDVATAMTLGLGALGFVVGMAVGAIIPSRNN